MPPGSEESPVSRRLPRKVESLESLYFTPIPSRTRSQLESSAGSLGDLSLDSGCKTRSARRRTTINITMTKVSGPWVRGREGSVGQDLCAEDRDVRFAVPCSLGTLWGPEAKTRMAFNLLPPLLFASYPTGQQPGSRRSQHPMGCSSPCQGSPWDRLGGFIPGWG